MSEANDKTDPTSIIISKASFIKNIIKRLDLRRVFCMYSTASFECDVSVGAMDDGKYLLFITKSPVRLDVSDRASIPFDPIEAYICNEDDRPIEEETAGVMMEEIRVSRQFITDHLVEVERKPSVPYGAELHYSSFAGMICDMRRLQEVDGIRVPEIVFSRMEPLIDGYSEIENRPVARLC
jgi:hypothetical protein